MLVLLALLAAQAEEAPRRDAFSKAFKEKDPERRVEALRTLGSAKEGKTVALAIAALKDPSPKVRTAAAEVLGTARDPDAAAIRPLCDVLRASKEDAGVRLAAARSLVAMPYRHDAIDALIAALASPPAESTNFAADVANLLSSLSGQDFGASLPKWRAWWAERRNGVSREDAEKRAKRGR